MIRLPFKPVINKINGNYYAIPAKSGTPYRTVIKCGKAEVQLIALMSSNISESRMIEKAKEIISDISPSDITQKVKRAREKVAAHQFREGIFEVLEI